MGVWIGFLAIIPFIGPLLSIIGFIVECIGIKKLSRNAQNEKDIFKNFILSFIFIFLAFSSPLTIFGFLIPDYEIYSGTDFDKVVDNILYIGIGVF